MKTDTRHLFSTQADAYRTSRPTYDPQLFAWLASLAPDTGLVWDCGCGSGQASRDLARYFRQVIATDINPAPLARAISAPNIEYRCEPAEATSLATGSVDLTVVAQALHWFNLDGFYAEVRRVSRPGGLLAALTYNLMQTSPTIDALIYTLYYDVLGPYWAAERKYVEGNYRTLAFPFQRIPTPTMTLRANWNLTRFIGYLESWSALVSYRQRTELDPLTVLKPELERCWGDPEQTKTIHWPLTILLGTIGFPGYTQLTNSNRQQHATIR
ncbi:MAG: class I SAM-dependent methyltransferase [Herbaspirillum sp.]